MSRAERDRALRESFALRPVTGDDYGFMRDLYESIRAEELDRAGFTPEQRRVFIDQQFSAQTAHYAQHYPTAQCSIVERAGQRIGRFYVDRWATQIRIVDIALASESRGLGIGSLLLHEVLEQGRASGKRVTIHVEAYNPALRLYQRLGFRQIDTNGVYFLMEWRPENLEGAAPADAPC